MSESPRALPFPAVSRVVLTLALGAAGGAVFAWFRLPLAWMIGAMVVTAVLALAGADLRVPLRFRNVMIAILGIMLGSAFTPEIIDQAARWTGSLASLVLFVIAVIGLLMTFLRRFGGFGPATAFFSSAPGGFSQMVLMGGAMGGDDRTIALMHSVRIMLAVLVIPFWFRLFQGYEPMAATAIGSVTDVTAKDAAILTVCAVAGFWGAARLEVPLAAFIGPMVLSAVVHILGITQAQPPGEAVAVAQVVIGAYLGCRFVGVSVKRFLGTLWLAGVTTLMMLALTVTFALVLEHLLDLPFPALFLAFAPGGLAEMTLISLAMGIDIAFVSTHHVVRLFLILVLVPIAYRLISRGGGERAVKRKDTDRRGPGALPR